MKQFVKYITLVISLFLLFNGCENKEMKELKKENSKLKGQLAYQDDKKKSEEEIRFTGEAENNRLKDITITITVDELKADGRKWDVMGGPDIIGEVYINDILLSINAPEDKFSTAKTISSVKLGKGDIIKVSLYDKDLSKSDLIGTGVIIFDGSFNLEKKIGSALVKISVE